VQRLQAIQEANLKMTTELQAHDELRTQCEVRTAEVEVLTRASISQRAQLRSLEGQVEDLLAVAASVQVQRPKCYGSSPHRFQFHCRQACSAQTVTGLFWVTVTKHERWRVQSHGTCSMSGTRSIHSCLCCRRAARNQRSTSRALVRDLAGRTRENTASAGLIELRSIQRHRRHLGGSAVQRKGTGKRSGDKHGHKCPLVDGLSTTWKGGKAAGLEGGVGHQHGSILGLWGHLVASADDDSVVGSSHLDQCNLEFVTAALQLLPVQLGSP
jgi:hypothetical protein